MERDGSIFDLVDKNGITASSSVSIWNGNGPDLTLDDNEDTLFHSNQYSNGGYGDVYFKFEESKVINKIEFLTRHPSANNGRIDQYEILYKNSNFDADWISIYQSEITEEKGWKNASFQDVLVSEVCIRVHRSYGNWIVMNDIKFYSNAVVEDDLKTIFESLDCQAVKSQVRLKNITELKNRYQDNLEMVNLLEVGKYLWLNNNQVTRKKVKLLASNQNREEYFNTLKIKSSLPIKTAEIAFKSKKEYLIISNENINLYIVESFEKLRDKKIEIKKGLNSIYLKEDTTEVFLVDDITKNIEMTIFNADEIKNYSIGKVNYKEFIKENTNILGLVEGKNFICQLNREEIKDSYNEFDFLQGVENLDAILNYIYFLLNRNEYYHVSPFKRVLIQGINNNLVEQKSTQDGSYTTFGGMSRLMFNKSIEELANPNFCRVIAKDFIGEVDTNIELQELLTFLLTKELEFRYSRVMIIPEDIQKALWIKLRLFFNSDRFLPNIYKKIQETDLSGIQNQLEKVILWVVEILQRDVSKYFVENGYEISSEILSKCNEYPELAIDLNEVNFSNYKELIEEEISIINENYKRSIEGNI
ncbi:discoidin domain-containing protein [Cetobacterium somerae]|uniref:discoidin domain-containing protein n=1 Tax=Cetobacterium somerae TaxID=188913 RepID=UPI003891856B